MENVWDYPSPPVVEPCPRRVQVEFGGRVVADSTRAFRVLERSHPPTIYLPPGDVATELLDPGGARPTLCEWKGWATHYDVAIGARRAAAAAWSLHHPTAGYEALTNRVAFHPGRVDVCRLDDEVVVAAPDDLYGGWLSRDVTGHV